MVMEPSPPPVNFQGKDPGEHFQFAYRQHVLRMIPAAARVALASAFIVLIGLVTIPFEPADAATRHTIFLLLAASFLLAQFLFLSQFYRHFLYVIVVTDRRVHRIKKTLLTTDEHETIDLWVLQDIHKHQRGFFQTLLGFGTLELEANNSVLHLHFMPHIDRNYQALVRLREQAREGMMLEEAPTTDTPTREETVHSSPHETPGGSS